MRTGRPHLQYQILNLLVTQYLLASKYKRGFKKTRKLFCVLRRFYHRYQNFQDQYNIVYDDEPEMVYSYKLMKTMLMGTYLSKIILVSVTRAAERMGGAQGKYKKWGP